MEHTIQTTFTVPVFRIYCFMCLLRFLLVFFLFFLQSKLVSPNLFSPDGERSKRLPFLSVNTDAWVDSVFNSLMPEERLAQLFMAPAWSNRDSVHLRELDSLVYKHKIGGLIFFQGGPVRQAVMSNYLQSRAKTPLLISMDCEWGLGMRLDSTIKFPRQMTFAAARNTDAVYEMGAEIARQFRRLGMHVNFAPDVDVNNNPLNPVIGSRSFGENKQRVAEMGIAYMKGLQDNGVLACAKHFPGHGDTDSDSHYTLPVIKKSTKSLDTLELAPFRELFDAGVGSVMVGHLFIPAYDTTKDRASTLSPKVVKTLLQDSLKYEGLIFTDAMNMKAVRDYYKNKLDELNLQALLAGNDILLYAEDIPKSLDGIKKAIEKGLITQEEIDRRCRKILKVKAWAGLNKYQPVELKNLYEDLNPQKAQTLNHKIFSSALTLLSNKNNLLPLKNLDKLNIACVSVGDTTQNIFFKRANDYAPVKCFNIAPKADSLVYFKIRELIAGYNLVIVNIQNTNSLPLKNYGINQQTIKFINAINNGSRKVVVNIFGNPYALSRLPGAEFADAVLIAYEENNYALDYAAQLVFGGISAAGKLPVNINNLYKINEGLTTSKIRLGYSVPEMLGYDSKQFDKIDSIALDGIARHAYPGCQILVAQKGKIIYRKNFGAHTYENNATPVSDNSIYDVASITKIAATLPVIMELDEKNKIALDEKISAWLPELKLTNKKDIVLREMLAHQSGLKAWIPFYRETYRNGKLDDFIYNTTQNETFPYRVAENLYIRKVYPDMIYTFINESEMGKKEYVYSDLGYYYLKKIAEKFTDEPLDIYVKKNYYRKLGMSNTTYHPRNYFALEKLVPTEYDMSFRKQLLQGDVHDPGAAMLGGVGGHAGLFSNTNDLVKLMQLYLQMGEYGGERFFSEEVMKEYTRCQFCANGNRRGLGFDKPEPNGKQGPTCDCVSYLSFGHSGFTGTYAWSDPDKQTVYIFLSNRVYPDADNKKLIDLNIRTKIQEAIYEVVK